MKVKKLSLLIFIILNFLFSIISCSGGGGNRFTNEPAVTFRSLNSLIDYSQTRGLAGSQAFIPDTLSRNTFVLPLDMNNDTVVYVFDSNTSPASDTLTLAYEIQLNPFGSAGCSEQEFTVSVHNLKMVESQSTFSPDEVLISIN